MPLSKTTSYHLVLPIWIFSSYLIESFAYFFSTYRLLNLLENIIFISSIVFAANFFKAKKNKHKYLKFIIVIILFMLWFETVMYYHFKISFESSSLYIILNSNIDELIEFLRLFVDFNTILITIFYLIPLLWLNKIVKEFELFFERTGLSRNTKLSVVLISMLTFMFLKVTRLTDQNLYYVSAKACLNYYKDLVQVKNFEKAFNEQKLNIRFNGKYDTNTFVIIIGESTTRHHMSLYGYYRNTSPELEKLKSELNVYNDVITSSTSTAKSLSKSMTMANYEYPEKQLAMPITRLFNKAGFKTFWISNHSAVFSSRSILPRITNQAQVEFHNTKEMILKTVKHDGELLPKFDEALNDSSKNKVIFLHLIGTHFEYVNRYPKEYDFFHDIPKTIFKSREAYTAINTYDNAVRYNDYIVSEVIKKAKLKVKNGYVMYFSDHGEEVFQSKPFFGHFEEKPTRNTFEIPFLMWYSDDFDFPEDFKFMPNVSYMTDDLWHSIVHISSIKTQLLEKERSIFSKHFKPRTRIVLEDKNYDTFLK